MKPVTVEFDIQPNSSDYGKIVITVTNDVINAPLVNNIHAYISIEGPNGTVKAKTYPSTEDIAIIGTGNSGTYKADIPTDSDGDFVTGSYVFDIDIEDRNDPDGTPLESETATYTFTPEGITPDLQVKVDCITKKLVATDATAYGDLTPARTITIDHPVVPNVSDPTNTTTSTSQQIIDITKNNVTYNVTLFSDISQTSTTGSYTFTLTESVEAFKSIYVQCDLDLCNLIDCINSKVKTLIGDCGLTDMPPAKKKELDAIRLNLAMYHHWLACNNWEEASYYYNKLKELIPNTVCADDTVVQDISDHDGFQYLQGETGSETITSFIIIPDDNLDVDITNIDLQTRRQGNFLFIYGTFDYTGSYTAGTEVSFMESAYINDTYDVDAIPDLYYPLVQTDTDEVVGIIITKNSGDWKLAFNANVNTANSIEFSALIPLDV